MTGGLDSYIIWRLEGRPQGLFYDFGHPSNAFEMNSLSKIEDHFGKSYFRIVAKEDLLQYEMAHGYMPYRNLFLLLWASLEYPDVEILFGQVLEWLPDKNPGFYRMVERIARDLGRRNLQISVPYKCCTKTQMVAMFLNSGFDKRELIELTYSCMNSVNPPCGCCPNCISRYIAFRNNGFAEPLQQIPTRAIWARHINAKLTHRNFDPRKVPMYVKRWLEAERAFRNNGVHSHQMVTENA